MQRILQGLREMDLAKVRSAVALLPLSLMFFMWLLSALMAPPEVQPAMVGLVLCYLVAFIALAAEWFWGRWYASGIGWWGAIVALIGMLSPDSEPLQLGILGGLHVLVIVMLLGKKMAKRYELQPAWRERFGMDEYGVARLGKAVLRGSVALPGLILWALLPKQDAGSLAIAAATVLTVVGLVGLLRLRTWGLFAFGGAAVAALNATPPLFPSHSAFGFADGFTAVVTSPGTSGALALLLAAATLPFASSAIRYFRSLR